MMTFFRPAPGDATVPGDLLAAPPGPGLTARDVCDATASGVEAALVRVARQGSGMILDFCGHHFEANEVALALDGGWAVTCDIRPHPELRRPPAEPPGEPG